MTPQPRRGEADKALAKRIKQARKEAGLTQVEAAQRLGKPQSFISKCETGERRIDALDLMAFAHAYGKRLSYFNVRVSE